MKYIDTPINERLKDVRTYFGYSQREIATKLGIRQSTYAAWELNKRLIPLKHLNSLSNIYQLNIDYILGLTDLQIPQKQIFELDKSVISQNLKVLLRELNMNVTQLANSINISYVPLYNYLNEVNFIPTYVIYDLARQYSISTDWLLGRSKYNMYLTH